MVCGHHLQNHFLFRGYLVASPVHLLSLSFALKQVKLIHNHLCFLTGQINIPEVSLIWCYAVLIKCSLNFFEKCVIYSQFVFVKWNCGKCRLAVGGLPVRSHPGCVEVSLSKTPNPQLLLTSWLVPCMAANRRWCVNVCVNG